MSKTTTLSTKLWWREFVPGIKPGTEGPYPDKDTEASEDFQRQNFVDHFGSQLRTDEKFRKHNSYDSLCSSFWDSPQTRLQTYVVADGQTIPKEQQKAWFRSELRFISLVLPVDKTHEKNTVAPVTSVAWADWFFFIASSADIHSHRDILHVMSWSKKDGQFRYYARDLLNNNLQGEYGWVYLCSSEDAFNPKTAYLGPLNGHVNGGLVMKEVHKPWLHWLQAGRDVFELLTPELYKTLGSAKWLTTTGFPPLYGASVDTAETLERIILDSLREWFVRRKQRDFFEAGNKTRESPANILRWASHFLLTTNFNIAACPNGQTNIPYDFFFNYEMLRAYSDLLPNKIQSTEEWQNANPCPPETLKYFNSQTKPGTFNSGADWTANYSIGAVTFDPRSYMHNARKLKLCILQEVPPRTKDSIYIKGTMAGGVFMGTLGDGQEPIDGRLATYFAVSQWGEGDNPWVILQPSVEDAMGVWTAQKMFLPDKGGNEGGKRCRLFSPQTFNAMMMVDFWNPILSWRRLRLMQYIPTSTNLTGPSMDNTMKEEVYTYTLEAMFIAAVKKSANAKVPDTPEYDFLQNLEKSIFDHQWRISKYMQAVATNCASADYMIGYMRLAESRRRMFRPLPMNFFGSNLPFALAVPLNAPWLEMREDGTVHKIPQVGLRYLTDWLDSLKGFSPNPIPAPAGGGSAIGPDLGPLVPIRMTGNEQPHRMTPDEIEARVDQRQPELAVTALPKPSTMRMACQASISMTNPREETLRGGCPFVMRKFYDQPMAVE